MTDRYCPTPAELDRFRVGPMAPHLPGFADLISRQGYRKTSGARKVLLVADLSRWLQRNHISLSELNEERIEAFLKARSRVMSLSTGTAETLTQLLQHLRQAKVITIPVSPTPPCEGVDLIEQEYARFLSEERCLAQSTAVLYATEAKRFLSHCLRKRKIRLAKLRARDVTDFISNDKVNRNRRSGQTMASPLRSFLRFLFQKQHLPINLSMVVPRIPSRRLSELPRYLEAQQVGKLLRSCDRRRKIGKRDYAILLLSARLGLRAGELVRLTLDDIDWPAGELLVRGKRSRVDRLPLLQDVGRALADYLERARPKGTSRRVFLRWKAPYGPLTHHASIYRIVQSALGRAGLHPPHRGAHLLRHSLATSMLRNGASLAQIGQVLRHQQPQATEIYAKVDLNALRALAQPWQGGVR